MIILIRFLLVALFGVVIFCRPYFPNDFLYWLTYLLVFLLVLAYWFVSFWVSGKKASSVIGKETDFDIFVGKVPPNETDDLERGRFCRVDDRLVLVGKPEGKYKIIVDRGVSEVASVGFGYVAGKRKGFTLYYKDGRSDSFTNVKIFNDRKIIYDALGWEIEEK